MTSAPAAAAEVPGADDPLKVKPLSYVILVDESGSLGPDDIEREKDAAGILSIGELSPDSQVGVIGFGSSKVGRAQDIVCPLTSVSSPEVQSCTSKLRPRTAEEGSGTDIPQAIRQGLAELRKAPAGQPKVLFVLTDGAMAVEPGEGYGDDPARIPAELDRQLGSALAQARQEGVQIWPMGFGGAIDRAQLDRMAREGARSTCSTSPGGGPRASVAPDSAKVIEILQEALGDARCAGVTDRDSTNLTGEADLHVEIPAIATDVTIQVTKQHEGIEVSFIDPAGNEVHSAPPGIEHRGDGTRVESLRVTDPRGGGWKIHLKAPPGVSGPVSAIALWQGVVKSYVQLNPPQPAAGEEVSLSVFLQTREGNLTDPKALEGVKVTGRVEGGPAPVDVPLTMAEKGEFTARYTIPEGAAGPLRFTGAVEAAGVEGTRETLDVPLRTGPAPVSAVLGFRDTEIEPGGTVTGRVDWKISDGKPHRLRVLGDFPQGVTLDLGPAEQEITGTQGDFAVRLTFADDTPEGDVTGRIRVVDATTGDTVLDLKTLTVTVEPPPGFWDRYLWAVVAAAAVLVLLLAAFAWWRHGREVRRRIGPIALRLYRDNEPVSVETRPLNEKAKAMWFRLDTASFPPQLVPTFQHEGDSWTVTRSVATGGMDVLTPLGHRLRIDPGRPVEIEPGLSLGFTDDRALGVPEGVQVGVGGGGGFGSGDGPYGGGSFGSGSGSGDGPYGFIPPPPGRPTETPAGPYGPYSPDPGGGRPGGAPGPHGGSRSGPDDPTLGYGPPPRY